MEDTLLPNRYVPKDKEVGDSMEVFVYLDSEDRRVAITDRPLVMRDEFASLEVKDVNRIGAFLDWGLEKDLFLPFKEQTRKPGTGEKVFVKVILDEMTDRLLATMKWKKQLTTELPYIKKGTPMKTIVAGMTDLGYSVILDGQYNGLLYKNEVYRPLRIGDKITTYVKKVRNDGKLDMKMDASGAAGIEPNALKILDLLGENDGWLALHDKSDPEKIKRVAKMSKKAFKKAIGSLYKQRLISINADGIKLI